MMRRKSHVEIGPKLGAILLRCVANLVQLTVSIGVTSKAERISNWLASNK